MPSRTLSRAHTLGVPGVAALVALSLAACGGPGAEDAPVVAGASADVPEFAGPHAALFSQAFTTASSDFARDVLADEQITDAEFAETTERLRACLADEGITLTSFDEGGALRTGDMPDGVDGLKTVDACEASSGALEIGMVSGLVARNPENRDTAELMSECLVASGAVPESYTAEDWSIDAAGRFGEPGSLSPDLRAALLSCSDDPLSADAAAR